MKKLVLVGAGGRGYTHVNCLKDELPNDVSFEGVYDLNPLRAEYTRKACGGKKVYDDFDVMLDEVKPDIVLICTMDCNHHEYAVRAMEKGYDVMLEKPMTTDKDKCLKILDAEKRTNPVYQKNENEEPIEFNDSFYQSIKDKLPTTTYTFEKNDEGYYDLVSISIK